MKRQSQQRRVDKKLRREHNQIFNVETYKQFLKTITFRLLRFFRKVRLLCYNCLLTVVKCAKFVN